MRKLISRAALVSGAVLGVLALGGGVAAAAPAAGSTTDVAAFATCTYAVRYDGLAVRENPSPDSVARKTKAYGSIVTGPCVSSQHSSGEWYTAVHCACATDGEGWMRTSYLDRIS
ncbi:hypothetical protein [Saccharothrix lopnurensis]|uniref:SH3 domain-containing protein n=1 Tax=Saccharothrix lopnurensis TaxID=1670621 RepID=A0ABW1PC04_9PSEU